MRAVGAKPRTATVLKSFFQFDANTGWVGRPNVGCRFQTSNFDVMVSQDAEGFRTSGLGWSSDRDTAQPGEVVWCVGDSGTWGWGVADGYTYVDVLNRRKQGGAVYRNLGIPGFSSVQEYLLLKHKFERGQKPTQVVVLFCENDLEENLKSVALPRPYLALSPSGAELKNYPVPTSWSWGISAWLKNHSLVCNYFDFCLARLKKARRDRAIEQEGSPEERAQPNAAQHDEQVAALKAAYSMLKQLCKANHVRLAIATECGAAEYGPFGSHVRQIVEQVCAELEIPVFDLAPRWNEHLASSRQPVPLHFKTDPHYTEAGHRLLAEGIDTALAGRAGSIRR